ncbi:DUF4403 family protein [Aggregicoccus sp. 17bor-14]|uniref:DUF4403 family protein n=1 Tax=Myxococcaceae TaxID=31 RepID=UPI00129C5DD0|nr:MULTISPECIES: DUF4403 family protein [Myxococcaceae]MBF5041965.1 DUF4403 family protein [Simulacricoccus sp. 17bor-14]MRI87746.1 DUF4403 family protein [Aggregicoccus sp. 17bor-14]
MAARHSRARRWLPWGVLTLLLLGGALGLLGRGGCTEHLEVPRPALRPSPPPPELPESVVALPVELDLKGALAALEQQVPRVVDETEAWTPVANGRVGLKYRVERAPFQVEVQGAELHARFGARYLARACLRVSRTLCPEVASCGASGESPTLSLALRSGLSWSRDWHLRAKSGYTLDFPSPCRVTFLRYDVTERLRAALTPRLDAALAQLDARVPQLTQLRPRVTPVWQQLQRPLALGSGVWLALRPSAVQVTPPHGEGLRVSATLRVRVRPLLSVGRAPEVEPQPLPPLLPADGDDAPAQLALDARIGFAELGARLREQLRGRALSLQGHRLKIDDVGVEGSGGGALLRVHVTLHTGLLGLRRLEGDVYLTARPRYDAASGALVLEDVEYALGTEYALARYAERWGHETLRELLAQNARFPVRAQLERLRGLAEAGLQRELAPGLRLEGHVEAFTPLGVYAEGDGFVVRGQALGRLALHVDSAALLRPRAGQ